jgi:hypothetical protein
MEAQPAPQADQMEITPYLALLPLPVAVVAQGQTLRREQQEIMVALGAVALELLPVETGIPRQ